MLYQTTWHHRSSCTRLRRERVAYTINPASQTGSTLSTSMDSHKDFTRHCWCLSLLVSFLHRFLGKISYCSFLSFVFSLISGHSAANWLMLGSRRDVSASLDGFHLILLFYGCRSLVFCSLPSVTFLPFQFCTCHTFLPFQFCTCHTSLILRPWES